MIQNLQLLFIHDAHLQAMPKGLTYENLIDEFNTIKNGKNPMDNIRFYFYTLHRISAINSKISPYFKDINSSSSNVFKGRRERSVRAQDWCYGECGLANDLLAVGQPNGYISLIDISTNVLQTEFQAFSYSNDFIWSDVFLNSTIICCSGGSSQDSTRQQTKIFNYGGELLNETLPFVRMTI